MAESQLRDEDQLFEFETCRNHLLAETGAVVLVGAADLLDEAVEAEALEPARNL